MANFYVILLFVIIEIVLASQIVENKLTKDRSFEIDYDNNRFLKDGEPFRFIAGSFHYFRAHPESWQRKLRTIRAAGLNAVTTYVEWSLHNPTENVYNWEGIADLERFIKLAEDEGLLVILRPGPYICAERDLGGFPYWLLRKYPDIKLRTADINYLHEVRIWYNQLMGRMSSFLYGNGGPIIMVQVENEYGSFYACDKKYREWLRDETETHVQKKAVLFTNDGPSVVKCGKIDGVLASMDFGATSRFNLNSYYRQLRQYEPKGPIINAEYYPGWLTHWQEPIAKVDIEPVKKTFIDMLDDGVNVNFYMFFGGTNFGFTAGANDGGPGAYNADITSYDYDAPMNEAGDPTEKYFTLREIIGNYLPLPNISIPEPLPKKEYGSVKLTPCCSILSPDGRQHISTGTVYSENPLTFEALDQNSGLVLYETWLPNLNRDPSVLSANVHDRAYVYINNKYKGVLSRENEIHEIPIIPESEGLLQILVESQGRINFNIPNDFKGIVSDVIVEKNILTHWNITKFPLENYKDIESLIENEVIPIRRNFDQKSQYNLLNEGPTVFYGDLEIAEENVGDTYLDPTGWGKGIVFINGFNLGRYWPVVGPQITLYVPADILKGGTNQIVLIEYQSAASAGEISFTNIPNLDGYL